MYDGTAQRALLTHKFTGKERDTESGLDNFGARYDSSSLGRFMSPDPSRDSIRLDNPQTWNRYSYVLNNPLELVDPSGELWDTTWQVPRWVDECAIGATCVDTIAVNRTSDSVTVYGTQGENDITTYNANADGMINMRDVSSNPSAQFEVANNQPHPEEYLNPQAAAGLYNITAIVHDEFPNDSKTVMTAGSAENGEPARDKKGPLHTEHHNGEDVDLRYMGSDGKPIRGDAGAALGDVSRNEELIRLSGAVVLTGNPTKYGTVPIKKTRVQANHRNHMHIRHIR